LLNFSQPDDTNITAVLGFTALSSDARMACNGIVPITYPQSTNNILSVQLAVSGPTGSLTEVRVAVNNKLRVRYTNINGVLVQSTYSVLPDKRLSAVPTTVSVTTAFQTIPASPTVNVVLKADVIGFTAAFGNVVFATNCSQFNSTPGPGSGQLDGSASI
jgi:hypothetical protein